MSDAAIDLATPEFPPLLAGRATLGADPFAAARQAAAEGVDAGLVLHDVDAARLRAAVVLAPEVELGRAVAMLPLFGVAAQNAIGALGPPELPVHLTWEGRVLLNGAEAGRLRIAAADSLAEAVPDWMVVGLDLTLLRAEDGPEPGADLGRTALAEEGAGDLAPVLLLESWTRHALSWLHRWEEDGPAELHRDWTALLHGIGTEVTIAGRRGTFIGADERFGALIKTENGTELVPLTHLLHEGDGS